MLSIFVLGWGVGRTEERVACGARNVEIVESQMRPRLSGGGSQEQEVFFIAYHVVMHTIMIEQNMGGILERDLIEGTLSSSDR